MQPSQKCYDIIKESEGLVLHAYVDPGTGNLPITIGYGSTMKKDGTKFKLGDTVTKEEAEKLLEWEINNKAIPVDNLLKPTIVKQHQFDALVSFTYNVGIGNFKSSTLLKKVKANPEDETIKAEFLKWNKAAGKVLTGLKVRRGKEYDLYIS